MVLIKNLKFFLFLFCGKIGQKVFGDAVGRKLAYLVYKNIDLRKSQNLHFSVKFFLLFLSGKIDREKVFGDVVNRTLASEDYKNIDLRKSQNFFSFFFCKIGSEKLKFKTTLSSI